MEAPSLDFNFSQDSIQAVPMNVAELLKEYADGQRRFNHIDLKECHLSHAQIPFINLEESILQKANLAHANLAGAILNHVDFSSANLENANLIAADLVRAKLAGARLAGAVMSGANLSGANLRKTDLTGCTFAGANLSGVDFTGAILKDVNLGGANLRGANFSEVDLTNVDLSELNLEGTILSEGTAAQLWQSRQQPDAFDAAEADLVPDYAAYEQFSENPAAWSDHPPAEVDNLPPFDEAYDETFYAQGEYEDYAADPLAADWSADEAGAAVEDSYAASQALWPDAAETQATAPYDINPFEVAATAWSSDSADQPFSAHELSSGAGGDSFIPEEMAFNQPTAEREYQADFSSDDPFAGMQAATDEDSALLEPVVFPMEAAQNEACFAPVAEDAEAEQVMDETADTEAIVWTEEETAFFGLMEAQEPSADRAEDAEDTVAYGIPSSQAEEGQPDADANTTAIRQPRSSETAELPAQQPISPDPAASELAVPQPVQKHPPQNNRVVQSIQAVLGRRVQYSLQRRLLEIYNKQCSITGCDILPLLETVLINAQDRSLPDHPSQGLVLRADLKALYDLKLLAIHPKQLSVLLAPSLLESDYRYLQGRRLKVPQQKIYHPNETSLTQHLSHCKWYDSAYQEQKKPTASWQRSVFAGRMNPLSRSTALGLGMGGVAVAGLIWAATMLHRPAVTSDPVTTHVSTGQVEAVPESSIHLQTGTLLYKHQGMIVDGNAYLPMEQISRFNLSASDIPTEAQIVHQGQSYFKAAILNDLDIPIVWDAQTRTVTVDCCGESEVETVRLSLNGQATSATGLIIDNSAYVPVAGLAPLKLDLSSISPQSFVGYGGDDYLKASSLSPLSVQVQWDADTRTLTLMN